MDPCIFSLLFGFLTFWYQFSEMFLWLMVIFINLSFYGIISLNHWGLMRFYSKIVYASIPGMVEVAPMYFHYFFGFITILHQFPAMFLWIMIIFINLSFYAIISLNHCGLMRFYSKIVYASIPGMVEVGPMYFHYI